MELEIAIANYLEDIIRPIVKTAVEEAIDVAVQKALGKYEKEDLITIKEACELLRCSEPSFYNHVHKGNIELIKNGRRSLVHRKKLLEDLDAGRFRLNRSKHRG